MPWFYPKQFGLDIVPIKSAHIKETLWIIVTCSSYHIPGNQNYCWFANLHGVGALLREKAQNLVIAI